MYPELTLLGRFRHTGNFSAGSSWQPTPVRTTEPNYYQGMLNGKQVGELKRVVIRSPVSATGAADAIGRMQVVLDGGSPSQYISLDASLGTAMAPDPADVDTSASVAYDFGDSIWDPNGRPRGLDRALCPKFHTSAVPIFYADASTTITDPFEAEFWGYIYDSTDLAKIMPVYNPPDVEIVDVLNDRSYMLRGRPIAADGDWRGNWTKLPGGPAQTMEPRPSDGNRTTKVLALARTSTNLNTIGTTSAYEFNYSGSGSVQGVSDPIQNLYWNLSRQQAILLQRFGVVGPLPTNASPSADLLTAWVETPSEVQKRHPAGGIPTNYWRNSLRYGLRSGQEKRFLAVPLLPQGPQLLTNEVAYPTVIAQGAAVAASAVSVAVTGIYAASGDENTI